jgi:hypothetical protein
MDVSLISNSNACVRSFLFASGYCAVDALGDCLMMDCVPDKWVSHLGRTLWTGNYRVQSLLVCCGFGVQS